MADFREVQKPSYALSLVYKLSSRPIILFCTSSSPILKRRLGTAMFRLGSRHETMHSSKSEGLRHMLSSLRFVQHHNSKTTPRIFEFLLLSRKQTSTQPCLHPIPVPKATSNTNICLLYSLLPTSRQDLHCAGSSPQLQLSRFSRDPRHVHGGCAV